MFVRYVNENAKPADERELWFVSIAARIVFVLLKLLFVLSIRFNGRLTPLQKNVLGAIIVSKTQIRSLRRSPMKIPTGGQRLYCQLIWGANAFGFHLQIVFASTARTPSSDIVYAS
jgi:hypothetical protein